MLTDINHTKYKPGQIWTYHTRPQEEKSRLTILKVEDARGLYGLGVIVHIRVDGLLIQIGSKSTMSGLLHRVFTETALDKSVVDLKKQIGPTPDFQSSYNLWLKQFEADKEVVKGHTVLDEVEVAAAYWKRLRLATERVLSVIADPVNPTEADLKWWAYDLEAIEPDQDFDLIVSISGHYQLIFEFASDPNCPKQKFFLSCLYTIVGDSVRSNWRAHDRQTVEQLIANGRLEPSGDIARWATRSTELIASPDRFQYNLWCGLGNLAWNDDDNFKL
jgi:hypothetical protein